MSLLWLSHGSWSSHHHQENVNIGTAELRMLSLGHVRVLTRRMRHITAVKVPRLVYRKCILFISLGKTRRSTMAIVKCKCFSLCVSLHL